MKKNVKILIIAATAAVVLIGVMLLLIFLPKGGSDSGAATYDEGVALSVSTDENGVHQAEVLTNDKGEIENNSYGTLMEYVPAEISTIHVENSKGTLDITSETPKNSKGETQATVYTLVGYEDFDLRGGIADEIANDAASIEFSKVMTLDKSKAGDYGLDKPRSVVTVTYTDKTKSIIYVGDNAPQAAGTYIKFGDGDEVYLVAADDVSAFDYGVTDMISLTINNSAESNDNTGASSIRISGANFADTIELVPNSEGKTSASYIMTSPVKCYANEKESSLVGGSIRGLYADSVRMVNPSASQLSSLGLSKPYAHIKAVYPDVTVDLIAAQPDSGGNVLLMENGGRVVYSLASSKASWVSTSYEKLVGEYVLYPKINAVSKVSVNDGSKTYDFSLSSKEIKTKDEDGGEISSTTTVVKCGGKELELGYFQNFYQNIVMTELSEVKSTAVSGAPVFSVTYTYSSDGTSDTVSFYKAGGNKYAASVNGQSLGYVYSSRIDSIKSETERVANNENVETL